MHTAHFLFSDNTDSWVAPFVDKKYKHVRVIIQKRGQYMYFDPYMPFIKTECYAFAKEPDFLPKFKAVHEIISVKVYEPSKKSWLFFGWKTCNVLCALIASVEVGAHLTVKQFRNALIKYDKKTNYIIEDIKNGRQR